MTFGADLARYQADEWMRLAVERLIEIIGEAARRLSPAFRAAHHEIPWAQIIALRNVIAHDYDEIDNQLIWSTITDDIPQLLALLEPLIPVVEE